MQKDYYTFPALISKTGNNYGIYFYDLPGCIATGDTLEDVVHLAKEGLIMHLSGMITDGETIPTPTPIDDIRIGFGELLCLLDVNAANFSQPTTVLA